MKLLDWVIPEKLRWDFLSLNPNPGVIELFEQNPEKIIWFWLSCNPNAIHILEKNPDKIEWHSLSRNPALFELDYLAMAKDRTDIFREDLMKAVWHPNRLKQLGVFEINEGMLMEEDF